MLKEILSIVYGAFVWKVFCMRFRMNEQKIVLVLVNDQDRLDYYALAHIKDFMGRKYAKEAIIVFHNKKIGKWIRKMEIKKSIRLCYWSERKIEKLYHYYSFYKFSDKIVFTYTDKPKDNQLGKVLRETSIGEEEAVCLGLYRLRRIPE